MTNRFFTSDTHFGHKNIIRYCDRPFKDFEEMDEAIVENWNHVVGDTDVVYHLGDLALGPSDRWHDILTSLNGYKIFVVGNHDRIFAGEKARQRDKWDEKYHEWFDEVYDNIEELVVLENGLTVNLSHFPYDGDHTNDERYAEFRLKDKGVPLIHGHTHKDQIISRSKKGSIQIHVGQDAFNYTPVSEQQVIDFIRVADDLA
jgi:calcineurin-like phosphoesterase family protein